MRKNYKSALLITACACMAYSAQAAQWIWKGTNKNWSTKSNWTVLNAPNNPNSIQPTDTVIIPPGVSVYPQLGGGTQFGRLELRGGNIDFSAQSLTVTDSFIWTGGGFVNSNSSGVDVLALNNVRVNFTGTTTLPSNVRLTVAGGIWFRTGIINIALGAMNDAVMKAGSTTAGASNISHISGRVRKEGNTAYTFPVGDGGQYAPISITAPSNTTDAFTARYFYAPYINTSSINTNGLDHINITEHWILDRTIGISNVGVTLSYKNPRSGQITEPADLVVARFNGSQWISEGVTAQTGNNVSGTVTSNVVTDFSPFTLGSTSTLNPLPVQLSGFRAIMNGKKADLSWIVSQSENLEFFIVEKSLDGQNWFDLGRVDAAEQSNTVNHYAFADMNLVPGTQFYRLRISETGEEAVYSSIVSVKSENSLILAYPNPGADVLHINTDGSDVEVKIYDNSGRLIMSASSMSEIKAGLDIRHLNKGLYTVEIMVDGSISRASLLKN